MQSDDSRKHLTLVPDAEAGPKQAAIERVKAMKRAPGMLQCSKCGGRDTMTVVTGSYIGDDGKIKRGTVTADKVCYHCDKRGILSFMVQDPPRLVKEPKTRRTKLKFTN